MNTVVVVTPDGAVHERRSSLDPGFAVAILAGGRWEVCCYTATRKHADVVAAEELGRRREGAADAAVVPTRITRDPRSGRAD